MKKIIINRLENIDDTHHDAVDEYFTHYPHYLNWEGRGHAIWIISNYGLTPASDDITDDAIATQYVRCLLVGELDIDIPEMIVECSIEDVEEDEDEEDENEEDEDEEDLEDKCKEILEQMRNNYEWDEGEAFEKKAIADHSAEVLSEAEELWREGDIGNFLQHAQHSGYSI